MLPCGTAVAATATTASAKPALYPRFRSSISDYVSRCGGKKKPLQLRVAGRTTKRKLRYGQATTFRVGAGTYHVRCLPPGFPEWRAKRSGKPQADYYITTPLGPGLSRYVVIFDNHGVPVWWSYSPSAVPFDAKLLPDGDLAWARWYGDKFGVRSSGGYEEHRFDGSLVRLIRAVGNPTDTHDMEQLPNGDYMVITYRKRTGVDISAYGGPTDATVYDGELQEVTPGGQVVWSWNSKDHIDLSETKPWWPELIARGEKHPNGGYDIFHLNTVTPDGDNGFVISGRHVDAVYRIDKSTGNVTWKVGGTDTARSLTVVGDPFGQETFGGQHDARLYRDGTLTVHDNGTARDRPPRAVRFAIDVTAGTATLLEDIRTADIDRSGFGGSAHKMDDGNWVISWGGKPLVTEQTPSGSEVFRIAFHKKYSFRVFAVPPGKLSAASLRGSMDRMPSKLRGGPGS